MTSSDQRPTTTATGQPRWTFALRRANAVRCWLDTLDGTVETREHVGVDPFSLRHMIHDAAAGAGGGDGGGGNVGSGKGGAGGSGSGRGRGRAGAGSGLTYGGDGGLMHWSQEGGATDPSGFSLIATPFPAGQPLMETTCLVVGPKSATGISRDRLYTQIFSIAAAKGFACIGARMVHMAPQRAQAYVLQAGRPKITVRKLVPGPVLVLALQRDNAVSCTDMLLCSRGDRDSLQAEMGVSIFAPASKTAAKADLAFFFAECTTE